MTTWREPRAAALARRGGGRRPPGLRRPGAGGAVPGARGVTRVEGPALPISATDDPGARPPRAGACATWCPTRWPTTSRSGGSTGDAARRRSQRAARAALAKKAEDVVVLDLRSLDRLHRLLPARLGAEPEAAGGDRRRRARGAARHGAPPGPRRGLPAAGVDPARLLELRRPRLHARARAASTTSSGCGAGPSGWRSRGDDGGARRARRRGGRVAGHARAPAARRCASPRRAAPCCSRARAAPARTCVAHWLHYGGPRREGPFIKVHCPSIPEELLESELFGHEKGAFTDARHAKAGKIEMAAGGTLYFDQVQDLVPPLQAKLLRVVEERRFERLGGTRTLEVDVRFVASSNVDLAEAVRGGALPRGPLPPPERGAAAARPRCATGARTCCRSPRLSSPASASAGTTAAAGFAPEAAEVLRGYLWPGNVRELRSVVERARARRALGRGAAGGAAAAARRAARDAVGGARPPPHPQGRRAGLHPLRARRRWAAARRGPPRCWASAARPCGRSGAVTGSAEGGRTRLMDQKKLKVFRERLLQKKQEILEAYNKNKTYGKEADGEAPRTSPTRRRTPTRRSSCSASRTPSATCCSSWTRRSSRIDDRRFGVCVVVRGRDGQEAPRGGAVGAACASPARRSRSQGSSERETPPGLCAAAATARRLVDPVLAVVFPSACPACARLLAHPDAGPAVRAVLGEPAPPPRAVCRCGLPLAAAGSRACGRCRRGLSAVRARAPASAPTRARCGSCVHELKYRGRRRAARPAGRGAARGARGARPGGDERRAGAGAAAPAAAPGARLQPVRAARRRARAAGGDGRVPGRAGAPPGHAAAGRALRGRAAAQRRGGVRGAPPGPAGRAGGVLVDDVLTTGATARACARRLARGGRARGAAADRGPRRVSGTCRGLPRRREDMTRHWAVRTLLPPRCRLPRPARRRAAGAAGAAAAPEGRERVLELAHQVVVSAASTRCPSGSRTSTRPTGWRCRRSPSSPSSPARGPERRFTGRPPAALPLHRAARARRPRSRRGSARRPSGIGRLPWLDPGVLRPPRGGLQGERQGRRSSRSPTSSAGWSSTSTPPRPHRQLRRPEDRPARPLGALRRRSSPRRSART